MSCITITGREKRWNSACDVPLPRHSPAWTTTKRDRLAEMANSETASLRLVAAAHPKIGEYWLRHLLMDRDVRVRRAAVKNPTLPDHLLQMALADADMGIAAYARLLGGG